MMLSGRARLAGVVGWPVAHSRSPRLHGYWLDHHGIDGAYVPLGVQPEHFADALIMLARLGFAGMNVTLPHKEAALAAVDEADADARRIGAVNTIVIRGDASLFGTNTDARGFIANLREQAPAWHAGVAPVVMLGAGGAARAAAVALLDAGVPGLCIVNRTARRAEALAATLGEKVSVAPWCDRHRVLVGAGLLVNTTSLGMEGHDDLNLDLGALPRDAVVHDIVYAPLKTQLLAAARARGHVVVDGLGMLLHQARAGFAAWFGVQPEVTPALREFMLADLGVGADR
jgi:shikimate dehydrogenase